MSDGPGCGTEEPASGVGLPGWKRGEAGLPGWMRGEAGGGSPSACAVIWFRIQGSGFRVSGFGFGFKVQVLCFRVLRFRV